MFPTSTRTQSLFLLYPSFLDQLGPISSHHSQTCRTPYSDLYNLLLHVLYMTAHPSGWIVLFYDVVTVISFSSLDQAGNYELLDY